MAGDQGAAIARLGSTPALGRPTFSPARCPIDAQRFDALARLLSRPLPRRRALGLLLAAAAPAAVGRRAAPAAAAIACRPDNVVSVPCEHLNDYVARCGVVCPSGRRLRGKGGCTEGEVRRVDDPNAFADVVTGEAPRVRCPCQSRREPWCTTGPVTVDYDVPRPPRTRILRFTPAGTPCCRDVCRQEVAEVLRQLQEHEDGHVANIERAAREATAAWRRRPFAACGRTREAAKDAFVAAVRAALDTTQTQIEATIREEPPQARPIDCAKCAAGATCCNNVCCAPGQVCCDGRCQASLDACTTCPLGRFCPDDPERNCCPEGTTCCALRPPWTCCPAGFCASGHCAARSVPPLTAGAPAP